MNKNLIILIWFLMCTGNLFGYWYNLGTIFHYTYTPETTIPDYTCMAIVIYIWSWVFEK
jgi:hypothetical protein